MTSLLRLNGLRRIGRAVVFVLGATLAGASLEGWAAVHYVNISSTNPVAPYLDWSTAAKGIQNAVDVASSGDTVLVADGRYTGAGRVVQGTVSNCVAITNAVLLQSLNGPAHAMIAGTYGLFSGQPSYRCLYLANGASVSGLWLASGGTANGVTTGPDATGPGIWCPDGSCVVTNCIIGGCQGDGNVAAIAGGTVNNCWISNNLCTGITGAVVNSSLLLRNSGSGAAYSVLNNCTVLNNVGAWSGPVAGALYCVATNCIVYDTSGASNYIGTFFDSSCTWPLPASGYGNFRNGPGFVGVRDFHLASTSPCVNAGRNLAVLSATDLDGHSRVVGGAVDVGCFEFQTPTSAISYAWLQYYGLPTDGSADFADADGDGMNNWQEWRCGTDPTNASSVLMLLSANNGPSGVAVMWQSVSNRTYSVERATDLTATVPFTAIANGVAGQPGTTTFFDGNGGDGQAYYRIRVEP